MTITTGLDSCSSAATKSGNDEGKSVVPVNTVSSIEGISDETGQQERSPNDLVVCSSLIYKVEIQVRTMAGKSPSLCPHLLQEYFKRVGEIIETYTPQIVRFVKYEEVSESLLKRGILRSEEDKFIRESVDSSEAQMESVLDILQNRMWGLENLITVLIEINVESWLVEEMFQKYVHHLVNEIRRLQDLRGCKCFEHERRSIIRKAVIRFFEKCDEWLFTIGTSIGFLTQTIYPKENALQFINNLLPIPREKDDVILSIPSIDSAPFNNNNDDYESNVGAIVDISEVHHNTDSAERGTSSGSVNQSLTDSKSSSLSLSSTEMVRSPIRSSSKSSTPNPKTTASGLPMTSRTTATPLKKDTSRPVGTIEKAGGVRSKSIKSTTDHSPSLTTSKIKPIPISTQSQKQTKSKNQQQLTEQSHAKSQEQNEIQLFSSTSSLSKSEMDETENEETDNEYSSQLVFVPVQVKFRGKNGPAEPTSAFVLNSIPMTTLTSPSASASQIPFLTVDSQELLNVGKSNACSDTAVQSLHEFGANDMCIENSNFESQTHLPSSKHYNQIPNKMQTQAQAQVETLNNASPALISVERKGKASDLSFKENINENIDSERKASTFSTESKNSSTLQPKREISINGVKKINPLKSTPSKSIVAKNTTKSPVNQQSVQSQLSPKSKAISKVSQPATKATTTSTTLKKSPAGKLSRSEPTDKENEVENFIDNGQCEAEKQQGDVIIVPKSTSPILEKNSTSNLNAVDYDLQSAVAEKTDDNSSQTLPSTPTAQSQLTSEDKKQDNVGSNAELSDACVHILNPTNIVDSTITQQNSNEMTEKTVKQNDINDQQDKSQPNFNEVAEDGETKEIQRAAEDEKSLEPVDALSNNEASIMIFPANTETEKTELKISSIIPILEEEIIPPKTEINENSKVKSVLTQIDEETKGFEEGGRTTEKSTEILKSVDGEETLGKTHTVETAKATPILKPSQPPSKTLKPSNKIIVNNTVGNKGKSPTNLEGKSITTVKSLSPPPLTSRSTSMGVKAQKSASISSPARKSHSVSTSPSTTGKPSSSTFKSTTKPPISSDPKSVQNEDKTAKEMKRPEAKISTAKNQASKFSIIKPYECKSSVETADLSEINDEKLGSEDSNKTLPISNPTTIINALNKLPDSSGKFPVLKKNLIDLNGTIIDIRGKINSLSDLLIEAKSKYFPMTIRRTQSDSLIASPNNELSSSRPNSPAKDRTNSESATGEINNNEISNKSLPFQLQLTLEQQKLQRKWKNLVSLDLDRIGQSHNDVATLSSTETKSVNHNDSSECVSSSPSLNSISDSDSSSSVNCSTGDKRLLVDAASQTVLKMKSPSQLSPTLANNKGPMRASSSSPTARTPVKSSSLSTTTTAKVDSRRSPVSNTTANPNIRTATSATTTNGTKTVQRVAKVTPTQTKPAWNSSKKPSPPPQIPERVTQFSNIDDYNFTLWTNQWQAKADKKSEEERARLQQL